MAVDTNVYGIKYEVDIDELKTSTQEASRQIKLANAKFNEASSTMDNWAHDVDGLGAKLEQLNSILEAEKTKLAQSKKSYNDLSDSILDNSKKIDELKEKRKLYIHAYGEESQAVKDITKQLAELERTQANNVKQADNLTVSISNQQAKVNKTERAISSYSDELELVKRAQANAEKSGRSLEDELNDLKNASDDVEESTKNMGDGFTVLKGTIANLIANGISAMISGLQSMAEESKENMKIMGALNTSSKLAGYSASDTAKTYKQLYGILGDDQTTATTVANLQALGLSQKQLTELTEGAIGAWAKYGDSIPIDGLAESINETVKVGQVTGTFADVLNWAGTSEDSFNEKLEKCKNSTERANLVLKELSKQGLTQSAQDFRENSKALVEANEAQAKWQETTSKAGNVVLPVMSSIKLATAEVLGAFLDLITGAIPFDEFQAKISTMATGIITTFTTLAPQLLTKGIEMITNLSAGFVQGFPNLLASLLTIVQNIGNYLSQNAPTFIQKGFEILSNIVQGILNAIPVMIEKIPQIIITFADIINNNLPTILKKGAELLWQFVTGIIGAIPTLIANMPKIIEAIYKTILAFNWLNMGKTIITNFGNGIKSMVEFVKSKGGDIAKSVWNSLTHLPQTLWNLAKNMISKFGQSITNATGTVSGAVKGVFNAVVNGFKALPSKIGEIGGNLVKGLANGISNMTDWVIGKIKGFTDSILDGIKGFFGIHSPSRETAWIGEMLMKGLGVGIDDQENSLIHKVKKMGESVMGAIQDEFADKVTIDTDVIAGLQNSAQGLSASVNSRSLSNLGGTGAKNQNITFNQTINSPKAPRRLDLYRNTRTLLISAKGELKNV